MHSWTAGDVLFRLRRSMPISNVPSNSVSAVLNGSGPRRRSPRRSILPMFGTILHKAMELLYTPLLNIPEPGRQIRALIGSAAVADAVTRAVSGEYLRDRRSAATNTAGMSCWCEISSYVISIVASCPMTPLIQAFGLKVWNSRSRPRSPSVGVVKHLP